MLHDGDGMPATELHQPDVPFRLAVDLAKHRLGHVGISELVDKFHLFKLAAIFQNFYILGIDYHIL